MEFDLIIAGGTIVDGTGALSFKGDIGIRNGKIEQIGMLGGIPAKRTINANGKTVTPGFIDIHCHTDMAIHREDHPKLLESLVRQGITTVLGGNCGMGLAPLGEKYASIKDYWEAYTGRDESLYVQWKNMSEFLETIEKKGVLLNFAMLAPHGVMRIGVSGLAQRLLAREELDSLGRLLEESMEGGAMGLSTGLQYFPGSQSDTEELIQLANIVKKHDGIFTSHLRSYSNTLDLAIDEVVQVAKNTEVPVQISHLFWIPHIHPFVDAQIRKLVRMGSWLYQYVKAPIPLDSAVRVKLQNLDNLIKGGLPLGIDAMPTSSGFTHLLAFFPPWVLTGGKQQIIERIRDPQTRASIRRSIEQGDSKWPHREGDTWSMNFFKLMGWECAFIMSVVSEKNKYLEGKTFVEIAKEQGKHPFDVICDLLLEEQGRVLVFETITRPGDDFVERSLHATLTDPNVSIATDTILLGYGRPSHLFYDCFPKFLGKYVRDESMISLREAVRKCTSLPAKQVGIKKRGEIKKGYWADLVILDPATIASRSTFEDPCNFPVGIHQVIINGKIVIDEGIYKPNPLPGMVIRRQSQ